MGKCECGHIQSAHERDVNGKHRGACTVVTTETTSSETTAIACPCAEFRFRYKRITGTSEENRLRRQEASQSVIIISTLNEQRRRIEHLEREVTSLREMLRSMVKETES